jgi:hypothetical protein
VSRKKSLLYLLAVMFVTLTIKLSCNIQVQGAGEYERYVHRYVNSPPGNWTYLEKPVFPVFFNESQIHVGQNWSLVCPLVANHSYHVYYYGKWIDTGPNPQTDYDIYVYDPLGGLESYHTEAAGLLEHLGTTAEEPLFLPKISGNYTFVIRNDPRESNGTKAATFMIIEDVKCNVWHSHYVEGKNDESLPVFATSWAYEFCTESRRIEVWVKVPNTLDMYEARVYMMANPNLGKGTISNNVPLAWEPGLYGNRSDPFGGYNLESTGYRGLAYSSCESYGQNMFMNFTSPFPGKSLYHLVFIGEAGAGTIDFLVKTEFGKAGLEPSTVPGRVYPNNDTVVAYLSNSTDLTNATLQYSTKDWTNATNLSMKILNDNRTCRAVVPGQKAGTSVTYKVVANDILESILKANGSYSVKYPTTLNVSLPSKAFTIGENVIVRGYAIPANADLPVMLTFTSGNLTKEVMGLTFDNGTFVIRFKPEAVGTWELQAVFAEDKFRYGSESAPLTLKVEEPSFSVKYSLYIGGGVGAATVIAAVVYTKKIRE